MSGSDRIHYICVDIFKHLAVKSIVRPLRTHRVFHNMAKQEKQFLFDRNETAIRCNLHPHLSWCSSEHEKIKQICTE